MSDRFLEEREPSAEYLRAMEITRGYVEMAGALFEMSSEEFERFLKSGDDHVWKAVEGFLENRRDRSNLSEVGVEHDESFQRFCSAVSRPEILKRLCLAREPDGREELAETPFETVTMTIQKGDRFCKVGAGSFVIYLKSALLGKSLDLRALSFLCEKCMSSSVFARDSVPPLLVEGFKQLAPYAHLQARSAFKALGASAPTSYDPGWDDESSFLTWMAFDLMMELGCPLPEAAQLALLEALPINVTDSCKNQQADSLDRWLTGERRFSPAVAEKACQMPLLPGWLKARLESILLQEAGPGKKRVGARL